MRDDAVLFVRQARGHGLAGQWTIPWGALEDGESPSRAALRETSEEAGVNASVEGFLGVQAIPAPWTGQLALLFRCRHLSGEPSPDGRETDRAAYLRADELAAWNEPIEPFSRWLALQVLMERMRPLAKIESNPFSTEEGYFAVTGDPTDRTR